MYKIGVSVLPQISHPVLTLWPWQQYQRLAIFKKFLILQEKYERGLGVSTNIKLYKNNISLAEMIGRTQTGLPENVPRPEFGTSKRLQSSSTPASTASESSMTLS